MTVSMNNRLLSVIDKVKFITYTWIDFGISTLRSILEFSWRIEMFNHLQNLKDNCPIVAFSFNSINDVNFHFGLIWEGVTSTMTEDVLQD